jgi:hypothetical protein
MIHDTWEEITSAFQHEDRQGSNLGHGHVWTPRVGELQTWDQEGC